MGPAVHEYVVEAMCYSRKGLLKEMQLRWSSEAMDMWILSWKKCLFVAWSWSDVLPAIYR
jgi:hypothetical protein